ncbi:MAG: aldo/keto reductase [Alphaproteobacteria bacterium]|nr:aldo/keto reductase [Alphaproteobacteria bacterium]
MHRVSANGANVPAIGFGTWTLKGDEATSLVAQALESGYRHVDTAAMYGNEEAVGAGLRTGGLGRDEVFLTTKIWHTDLAEGALSASLEASLDRLQVEQVDLALIHWPSSNGVPLDESIAALNACHGRGWARHIGVSNFPVKLLDEAVALSAQPLVCNQVEYHPMLNQDAVYGACRRHGMAMVSYCPLFRGGDAFSAAPVAQAVEAHGRSPAQIILRWHVQQAGVIAIPRTRTPSRIAENLAIFDFELSEREMAAISGLTVAGSRICDFDFSPAWD